MNFLDDGSGEGLPQVQRSWFPYTHSPKVWCAHLRESWKYIGANYRTPSRLHSDFLSLGLSQVIAALGQIIGIRLLTEALSPAVFGEITLVVGVSTLATSVLVNPTMQALLRYYPEHAQSGTGALIERTALRRIIRNSVCALPLSVPLAIVGVIAGWVSAGVIVLLFILAAVDGMRLLRTTVMNASMQHHRYGAWQIGEAWGRPLLAYGVAIWWGVHAEIVLGAFIVTSLALYGFMRHSTNPRSTMPAGDFNEDDLLRKFENYARPLIPLGLLGWISGMADRYMIGGMLSAENVGMYAAAYGLASRPLLMLSSIAETSIRPLYYSAMARNDLPASRKYLVAWFVFVFVVGTVACTLFALFHQEIGRVLLGPSFREGSYLMPWIAGGYALLACSHVATRICYARDATRSVLITEAAGALLAMVIGFPLIYVLGLPGAAMAVPLFFGMQLLLSAYLARQSIRDSNCR